MYMSFRKLCRTLTKFTFDPIKLMPLLFCFVYLQLVRYLVNLLCGGVGDSSCGALFRGQYSNYPVMSFR